MLEIVLHTNDGLALSGVMEAICEGRSLAQQRLPITVRIIVCGMRHMPSSVSRQLAEITWRYRERGVVGFDLAGPEKGFSSKAHREAYELVRSKNLNATLHAGEVRPRPCVVLSSFCLFSFLSLLPTALISTLLCI